MKQKAKVFACLVCGSETGCVNRIVCDRCRRPARDAKDRERDEVLIVGQKKLGEVKAEVAALLHRLPGPTPRAWLGKEIDSAKVDRERDAQTLELLCAALERPTNNGRKLKPRRKPAKH